MSATAALAVDRQAHTRRRRHAQPPVSRRATAQLLVGVLIVGAIPIVSTVRILQANAVHSAQTHADATLRVELQSGLRELDRLGDAAAARAEDVARTPAVQRAEIGRAHV